MNAVLKIESLAAAPDSVVITIGTGNDLVPWEFLRCGDSSWIAPCPSCATGVIETDSPMCAAARCDECIEAEPVPEAVQAPPVIKAPMHPEPAQGQRSLVISSPAPVLTIIRPAPALRPLFGHQKCKRCSRYMTIDNSSGHIGTTCGTCLAEKAGPKAKLERRCQDCGADLSGTHDSTRYCNDCRRGRNITGQRRLTGSRKAYKAKAKEREAAIAAPRHCRRCQCSIDMQPRQSRYCPSCAVERDKEMRREGMAKARARMTTNESTVGESND